MSAPCIVWVRNDLRLEDNPALVAANATGRPVIVCFIWSEEDQEPYPLGGASRAWLHDSLIEFQKSLQDTLQAKLILRKGRSLAVLEQQIHETGARAVYWNRRYEPHLIKVDQEIKTTLELAGIEVQTFLGNVLFEPWEMATKTGTPYQVYTPFYKNCLQIETQAPLGAPKKLLHYASNIASESISGLALLTRNPPLDIWEPGEAGAKKALEHFLKGGIQNYQTTRDYPAEKGTSRLSPHLHFGEISARTLREKCQNRAFFREQCFREFAIHLLYHFPLMPDEPLRKKFSHFQWRRDPEQLQAWQEGLTGYPIVDAGMRELLATGYMHNRVRMIVGSFLVKHLLLSWREGASWFSEKLFDADLANNTFGWQWVAGCGADAAPFIRIFNPVLQGQKFDPEVVYVTHWVPELKGVAKEFIHTPWKASVKHYPAPIVDLEFARLRALEAFHEM
jgi:deoxyribodipyrimidine photo-lyase